MLPCKETTKVTHTYRLWQNVATMDRWGGGGGGWGWRWGWGRDTTPARGARPDTGGTFHYWLHNSRRLHRLIEMSTLRSGHTYDGAALEVHAVTWSPPPPMASARHTHQGEVGIDYLCLWQVARPNDVPPGLTQHTTTMSLSVSSRTGCLYLYSLLTQALFN